VSSNIVDSYQGQTNVRGILCDWWTATLTNYLGLSGSVVRETYFSGAGVVVNGVDVGRVPIRFVINGTLGGQPFYHSYEVMKFLPFLPPAWRFQELFGDCFVMRNVAMANVGDDDDDHHDDVNIPSLPELPDDFKMTMEINMFTHNSSYYIAVWQVGNLTRIDYESSLVYYTDITDGDNSLRYQLLTTVASNCTQMPLNSTTPFGGEPPGLNVNPMSVP